VTHVLSDGPAIKAGLAAGDLIVAVDGLKASQANIDAATALAKPGDKLELLAFRRDELMRFKLKLEAAPATTVGYKKDDSDTAKLAIRKAWLGA
jgi:predicted metalloprotease with PDZ domain